MSEGMNHNRSRRSPILLSLLAACGVSVVCARVFGWLSFALAPYDDVVYLADGARREWLLSRGDLSAFSDFRDATLHVPFMSALTTIASVTSDPRLATSILLAVGMVVALYPVCAEGWGAERRTTAQVIAVVGWIFCWPLAHHAISDARPDCFAGVLLGSWLYCYLHPRWLDSKSLGNWSAGLFLPALVAKENFFPLCAALMGGALCWRLLSSKLCGRTFLQEISANVSRFAVPTILVVAYMALRFTPVIQYLHEVLSPGGVQKWSVALSPSDALLVYLTGFGGDFLFGFMLPIALLLILCALICGVITRQRESVFGLAGFLVLAGCAFSVLNVMPIKSAYFGAPFAAILLAGSTLAFGMLFDAMLGEACTFRKRNAMALAPVALFAVSVVCSIIWSVFPDRDSNWRAESYAETSPLLYLSQMLHVGQGNVLLITPTSLLNEEQLRRLIPSLGPGAIRQCGFEDQPTCEAMAETAGALVWVNPPLTSNIPSVFASNAYQGAIRAKVRSSTAWYLDQSSSAEHLAVYRRRLSNADAHR